MQPTAEQLAALEQPIGRISKRYRQVSEIIKITERADSCYGKAISHHEWCFHECQRLLRCNAAVLIGRRNGHAGVFAASSFSKGGTP